MVERRSRKAQLSDKDIDLYHVEANPPLNNDSLQQLVPALFTSQGGQGSQQEERVLGSLASQVRQQQGHLG